MTKKLYSIINSIPALKRHQKQAAKINTLTKLIKQNLQRPLSEHCTVECIKKDTLILSTTNPTWMHQIRFSQVHILAIIHIKPEFKSITEIKTVLNKNLSHTFICNPLLEAPKLPQSSAEIITNIADNTKSPKLSKSLRRLANQAAPEDG